MLFMKYFWQSFNKMFDGFIWGRRSTISEGCRCPHFKRKNYFGRLHFAYCNSISQCFWKPAGQIQKFLEMAAPRQTSTINRSAPLWLVCCFSTWCGRFSHLNILYAIHVETWSLKNDSQRKVSWVCKGFLKLLNCVGRCWIFGNPLKD